MSIASISLIPQKMPSPAKVLFLGSKSLGLKLLQASFDIAPLSLNTIVTLDDSKDTRSLLPDFLAFAEEKKVAISVLLKAKELNAIIERNRPDFVIVCGWYWIIPKEILEMVPAGFVGLHASPLPRYRGFAPLVWSLINGEPEIGISFFYLEDGVDSGDLLLQKNASIDPDTTISEALEIAEDLSLKGWSEIYPLLLSGQSKRFKQANIKPNYGDKRIPEDGIIDWNKSAKELHNFIRAQSSPYPGAFTFSNGRKLYLWKSATLDEYYSGSPGQVLKIQEDSVIVACGEGGIKLIQAQWDGDEIQKANQILNTEDRLGT